MKLPSLRSLFLPFLILTFLSLGGSVGLRLLRYYQAERFSLNHIQSNLPKDPAYEIPVSPDEMPQISQLLSQPFFYLGKGSQCYVFESKDGTCVIKFFRHERYRIPKWLSALTLPRFLELLQKEKIQNKAQKREELFKSCFLAYSELREESGLLFLHLNPTDTFNTHLVLYDKIHRRYEIPIDHYQFILQKKAKLIYPSLKQWTEEGQLEKAKEALSALVQLLLKRYRKGIMDYDPVLRKNAGFLDTIPVYVDVGQFAKSNEIQNPEIYRKETVRITRKFRQWLEKETPDLVFHFDSVINDL